MENSLDDMTIEELKDKLGRLKDNLSDVEDMHAFTFGKTTLHIGAEQAQNMQLEFEEECAMYNKQIAEVEQALKAKGAL